MRIFVTGASGFVGSAIVKDLVSHGHEVLGLVRSQEGADKVASVGASPLPGDVNDPEVLLKGVNETEGVIHTAFNHDFSKYQENCEADRLVIQTLGAAIAGSDKPLVVTSGLGILRYDRLLTEDDLVTSSATVPRAASEEAATAARASGTRTYIVRLPASVHDAGDHGFVPILVGLAKQHGEAAYVGDGSNRWPAVHRADAATLYRLIVEQKPEQHVFHAAGEQGIAFKYIAETIGKGLGLPVVAKNGEETNKYFGWFAHFAGMDCLASSEKTRAVLNWNPTGPGLLHDIAHAGYLD